MFLKIPHPIHVFVSAGTMLTRADNEDIQTVDDIKGKVIGALAISDFAGAQVQFYVMKKNGLDYIMDPEQVIFTGKHRCNAEMKSCLSLA